MLAPSLPGCITYGKDVNEAQRMARDAIRLFVADLRANGEAVPQPVDGLLTSVELSF